MVTATRIVTRAQALSLGLKRYFTGKPCKHGHIAERTVDSCTCAECNRIISDEWNKKNTDLKRKLWKDWNKDNKKRLAEKIKVDRVVNPKKYKDRFRKWYDKNPERVRINAHKRRDRKAMAVGSFTKDDIKSLLKKQNNKCINCNVLLGKNYHVDHIVPLILGGTDWPSNLQILCKRCNLSKGGKDPIVWAQSQGKLL